MIAYNTHAGIGGCTLAGTSARFYLYSSDRKCVGGVPLSLAEPERLKSPAYESAAAGASESSSRSGPACQSAGTGSQLGGFRQARFRRRVSSKYLGLSQTHTSQVAHECMTVAPL